MRSLLLFLPVVLVHACCVAAAQAQESTEALILNFTLDWTNYEKQGELFVKQVQDERIPVPYVYVGGRLAGTIGDPVRISRPGLLTPIDVGISNFVERPLYSVGLAASTEESWIADIQYPRLALADEEAEKFDLGHAMIFEDLDDRISVATFNEQGELEIVLPAHPLAELAQYVETNGLDLNERDVIPVIHRQFGMEETDFLPPFPIFEEPDEFYRALGERESAVYGRHLMVAWVSGARQWFGAEPTVRISLITVPVGAEIWVHNHPRDSRPMLRSA